MRPNRCMRNTCLCLYPYRGGCHSVGYGHPHCMWTPDDRNLAGDYDLQPVEVRYAVALSHDDNGHPIETAMSSFNPEKGSEFFTFDNSGYAYFNMERGSAVVHLDKVYNRNVQAMVRQSQLRVTVCGIHMTECVEYLQDMYREEVETQAWLGRGGRI